MKANKRAALAAIGWKQPTACTRGDWCIPRGADSPDASAYRMQVPVHDEFDAGMDVWEGRRAQGRKGDSRCDAKNRKKRSSQASWKTCCLGTPFPRSALFL